MGHNSAGELTSQSDAKGQLSELAYDALGRVLIRSEKDAGGSVRQYALWTFGTTASAHDVGKLVEAKACTTAACTSEISKRTHTFDGAGRPYQTAISVAGASVGSYTSAYDANGRLDTLTYPSSYEVKYAYTALGYLKELKDAASGFKYWAANAVDAEGHLTQETLIDGALGVTRAFEAATGRLTGVTAGSGNSVANMSFAYDRLGNLARRSDPLTYGDESFCYDGLNRLVADKLASSINCASDAYKHVVSYNSIGNILTKTRLDDNAQLNSYSYPASGSSSVRPHAVSSVSGKVNGVNNPVYTYDSNGNPRDALTRARGQA